MKLASLYKCTLSENTSFFLASWTSPLSRKYVLYDACFLSQGKTFFSATPLCKQKLKIWFTPLWDHQGTMVKAEMS